jgi:quercetin dioxygenase-like cupin family protein
MSVSAVDIDAAISSLTCLKGRTPTSDGAALEGAFGTLMRTEECGIFTACFQGTSAWERHPNGDELVQVVKGSATVSVLHAGKENNLEMTAGSVTIVPRGAWHRFQAPDGVTVMTMTPQPTEHWREDVPPPEA